MSKSKEILRMLPLYFLVLSCMILGALHTDKAVTAMAENQPMTQRKTVIIDPGHGGVDGGATSCTGILESKFNLDISLRLRDVLHLLGIRTVMIRTVDESIYSEGDTIAAQKVSDLKQRVKIANGTSDAILISIHQNYYPDSKYFGAQVFYAPTEHSEELANSMQTAFTQTINPGSRRRSKKADGIYLMQHVHCPAILIECGFISNPREEALLRSDAYQKNLCCVIATIVSQSIWDS